MSRIDSPFFRTHLFIVLMMTRKKIKMTPEIHIWGVQPRHASGYCGRGYDVPAVCVFRW